MLILTQVVGELELVFDHFYPAGPGAGEELVVVATITSLSKDVIVLPFFYCFIHCVARLLQVHHGNIKHKLFVSSRFVMWSFNLLSELNLPCYELVIFVVEPCVR
jgi:hypothetical protein